MKRILCLMLSCIFILFTSGCSCNNGDEDDAIYEMKSITVPLVNAYLTKDINSDYQTIYPFNTSISLNYFKDEDISDVESYFKEEYQRLHMLFDRHYYYYDNEGHLINNLRIINESNGEVVSVSDDLIKIIKEGIRFTKLSKGKFNIGVGNLSSLWDFYINEGIEAVNRGEIATRAPSQEEINEAKSCTPSYENIENIIVVDEVNSTIKINKLAGCSTTVTITLGALAKSYAAEKITSDTRFDDGNYLLNAGQSTIKLMGKNLSRESREWQVGITDSYLLYSGKHSKYATYLMKLNESISVSTSSGDEKHYFYNDDYYHHIIDPISGYPNQNRFAVTATTEDAMYADIVTTSLMSMDMNETKEFLKALKENDINMEVIIQDKNEGSVKVYATNNMKNNVSIRFYNENLSEYLNSIVIEELVYES